MKTYFEIIAGKTYRQLTSVEREMIQDRQTQLVAMWQDGTDQSKQWAIEDELIASFKGLIKGMAFKQSEKSFSVDQEDFEGLLNLVLVETMIKFDRTLNIPFQPVFIMNVRNEIKMMYRQKGYDLHDTCDKLDNPIAAGEVTTLADVTETQTNHLSDLEQAIVTNSMLTECFGNDSRKKTIIHMVSQGFKRNEIVSAINTEGKASDTVARLVNRTVTQFKSYYLNLTQAEVL